MIKNKIKILMLASDLQGVGSFRSIWPAQAIEKCFGDEIEVEINHQPNIENIAYFQQFDIIHFHRHIGPYEKSAELFAKIKESGTILIMDIDDFWEPPTTHPLYELVKKENLSEKIIGNLKLADYVTTTTSIFADYIKEYNPNVCVIPNALNVGHKMWISEVVENKSDKCRISFIGGSCYDNQTEILTENGFKLFNDLNKDERVACLNPNTGELEYNKPLGYIKEKYSGKLQCGKNKFLDYAVTPNHKMYVSISEKINEKKLNFSLNSSEDVFGKNLNFKRDAVWNGVERSEIIIPKRIYEELNFDEINNSINSEEYNSDILCMNLGKTGYITKSETLEKTRVNLSKSKNGKYYFRNIPKINKYESDTVLNMDLWLKFFGFWIAEGWVSKTPGLYQIGIGQFKNNGYLEEIFNTLKSLGYNPTYTKCRTQVRVFDRQLWEYLSQFGKSYEKFIPKDILNLSSRQLNIFLEWYLNGDGNHETGGIRFDKTLTKEGKVRGLTPYSCSRKRAYTVSKKLADNIQEICLKIGVSSTITNRGLRNSKMKDGRLVNAKHDAYIISVGSSGVRNKNTPLLRSDNQFESDYNDYVYCVNVPNNIIFVRRNGKTMWCGNSHLHDLELMSSGFQQLWSNNELKDKFQIIMCGFDTRGTITEIRPNGERTTRQIQPHETVWRKFEEIFTGNFKERASDENYYKWLDKIVKPKSTDYQEEQYTKNYVRRWTLPLTQYGKHYDYCDVCLAPLIDTFTEQIKHPKPDGSFSIQEVKRRHIFNEVKSELKIIEAGMKKKVLIAQDFGIYKELIKDGVNGLLVKNDRKDWYKHMKRVVEDAGYREELANNLHNFVKDKYDIDNVTAERVEFYKEILKEKKL